MATALLAVDSPALALAHRLDRRDACPVQVAPELGRLDEKTRPVPQRLELPPRDEVVVHPVPLAGPRGPRGVRDGEGKGQRVRGEEAPQEGGFSGAGGAGQYEGPGKVALT